MILYRFGQNDARLPRLTGFAGGAAESCVGRQCFMVSTICVIGHQNIFYYTIYISDFLHIIIISYNTTVIDNKNPICRIKIVFRYILVIINILAILLMFRISFNAPKRQLIGESYTS